VRIRVIGVGTWRGDDAAGLAAARCLGEGALPAEVEVLTCERPAAELVEALAGAERAVVLDATRSGREPGSVQRVEREELRRRALFSSHALGVAEALALAEALGRQPRELVVIGIEAEGFDEGEELSAAVRRGVEEAARLARDVVDAFAAAGRPPPQSASAQRAAGERSPEG
jgi:hydrogenase maturation protease